MDVRIALVYAIGFGAMAYGFYQFWNDSTVNPQAFVIGGTCVFTAATVQVVVDIWRRLRRLRRR